MLRAGAEVAGRCLAALFTAAGEDVSVGRYDTSPTAAVQPHRLQLGRVWTAAGAGALEGLFEHRAEGDERVRASGAAAVALAARQQHHLKHSRAAPQSCRGSKSICSLNWSKTFTLNRRNWRRTSRENGKLGFCLTWLYKMTLTFMYF